MRELGSPLNLLIMNFKLRLSSLSRTFECSDINLTRKNKHLVTTYSFLCLFCCRPAHSLVVSETECLQIHVAIQNENIFSSICIASILCVEEVADNWFISGLQNMVVGWRNKSAWSHYSEYHWQSVGNMSVNLLILIQSEVCIICTKGILLILELLWRTAVIIA